MRTQVAGAAVAAAFIILAVNAAPVAAQAAARARARRVARPRSASAHFLPATRRPRSTGLLPAPVIDPTPPGRLNRRRDVLDRLLRLEETQ